MRIKAMHLHGCRRFALCVHMDTYMRAYTDGGICADQGSRICNAFVFGSSLIFVCFMRLFIYLSCFFLIKTLSYNFHDILRIMPLCEENVVKAITFSNIRRGLFYYYFSYKFKKIFLNFLKYTYRKNDMYLNITNQFRQSFFNTCA